MHVKLPQLEVLQLTHHMLNLSFLFHECIFSGEVIYDNFAHSKDVVGRGATMGVKHHLKMHSDFPRSIFQRKAKFPNRNNIPVLMTDLFKLFKSFRVLFSMNGSKVLILNL